MSASYLYRDDGSRVSVGTENSVGTLMGPLRGRSWSMLGALTRMPYVSLALRHTMIRRDTVRVKLH